MIEVKVGYFGYVIGIYSLYVTTIKEREFCIGLNTPQNFFLLFLFKNFTKINNSNLAKKIHLKENI